MHLQTRLLPNGRAFHARPVIRAARPVPVSAYRAEDASGDNQRARRPPLDRASSGSSIDVSKPAVQQGNNITGKKPSAPTGSSGSAIPSPSVHVANNINEQQGTGAARQNSQSAAQKVASNTTTAQPLQTPGMSATGRTGAGSSARNTSERDRDTDPADVLNRGIRDATDTAQDAITQTAGAAVGGVGAAADLTTQGISAAEQAAEDTARGLADAADEFSRRSAQRPARSDMSTPADFINQGIRSAAESAESLISQTAGAAVGGINAATNVTTQGVSATERAADDSARNLADAAERTLNAAAEAAGTAAGVVDGTVSSFSESSSRNRPSGFSSYGSPRQGTGVPGYSGNLSSSESDAFDNVNVRVPGGMAWANATPARGTMRDVSKTQDFDEDTVEDMKVEILAAVASLDRGLAANLRESREVDNLCQKLEDEAGPVTLRWSTSRSSPDSSTMDRLAGTWRLIYSSGFNGGSLGGSRPGPPAALVPTVLGQIYQVIDSDQMLLDNVVELLLNYGAPQLPFLPKPEPQPTPGVRITLRHTYEVSQPNSVTIVFESTQAKTIGPDLLQNLPQFGVPELPDFLKPPKNLRSASFAVTYLDASMRITRGDRNELRIFLRDKPLSTSAPADYMD